MAINIEEIKDFIRGHAKVFILSAAIVLVCLLLVIVALLAFSGRSAKEENAVTAPNALAIPPEEFFFPDEPLPLPGIQLSRESTPSWSEEEASRWFIPPSKGDLDELRFLGEESVTRLLEQVP